MKVKIDFVSNSSSASFILFVESSATTEGEFKKILTNFLADYYQREMFLESDLSRDTFLKDVFKECKIKKVSPNVFSVRFFTSIYNSYKDIPSWMTNMILRKEIENDLSCFGIRGVKLIVEEHN